MSFAEQHLRWGDYLLKSGKDYASFWQDFIHGQKRNVLFIMGLGFDRRMCTCLRHIMNLGGQGLRDVSLIHYHEGPSSASSAYSDLKGLNQSDLTQLLLSRGAVNDCAVTMLSAEGRKVGSRNIASMFSDISRFANYSDIIVDISSLPRGLYFPLLSKLLSVLDAATCITPNLHVTLAHSANIDQRIKDEGIADKASFLFGFSAAAFEREATRELPRIWIPLLGRGQSLQLEHIYELVQPDEICPLLPSPSRNPREADDLVMEYREILFDRFRVEPQNLIYASEFNPFEVYRQLSRSIHHYHQVLQPLGGCKSVLSATSSKLLSIGALLSAYELSHPQGENKRIDVGVAHVETQGYLIDGPPDFSDQEAEMFTMWLHGDCYE